MHMHAAQMTILHQEIHHRRVIDHGRSARRSAGQQANQQPFRVINLAIVPHRAAGQVLGFDAR
ncbi:MAG: hypothetical protein Q9P14_14235 [candidate division KSB1 bacterium]|nr:hypothetical protein [candidate division KSB1 bacterium]